MANSFVNKVYRSPVMLGNIASGILTLLVITAVLNIAISIFMVAFPDSSIPLQNGDSIETGWVMVGFLAITEIGLRLICAIFFLIWLYRAFNNLPVLGARNLEFSPGWAVGWWFVPLLNFGRPFQVVRELYRESDPAKRDDSSPATAPESFENIGFWWGTFIAFGLIVRLADVMAGGNGGPSHYFPVAYLVAHILMAISAVLAIIIVRTINGWQEQIFNRMVGVGRFGPPPPPTFDIVA